MQKNFSHYDLTLVQPEFNSHLTDLIIELDHLRKKTLSGSTPPHTFFQIKSLFHMLESIGSARIEGNRTTIAELVESKIENNIPAGKHEQIAEIVNMEHALAFIDENIESTSINRLLVSELHKLVVNNLKQEGSTTPGDYRITPVRITGASHIPPDIVAPYMDELFRFINADDSPKYDLLKTALAHHRFAWIHPFDNGNGRTVRLLTYAMMVKQGFRVNQARIINPTAVFCSDRNKYYYLLSKADTGAAKDLLAWCEYVLEGIKNEIIKIDKLLDYSFLSEEILVPAINFSLERKQITPIEAKILKMAVTKQIFKAADIEQIIPEKHPSIISRTIKKLKEQKLIMADAKSPRLYMLQFTNNYLLRGIMAMLDKQGFLPIKD
ncbi:MAG TPA: Fic family protein [bacterium]|nr:Fic family protein [bacterium]HPN45461.1 Fic family protein [bacterium]